MSDNEEDKEKLEVKRETVVRGVRIRGTVVTTGGSLKKNKAPQPPTINAKTRSVSFAGDTLPLRGSVKEEAGSKVVGEPKTKKVILRRSMSQGHYPAPQPPTRPKKS